MRKYVINLHMHNQTVILSKSFRDPTVKSIIWRNTLLRSLIVQFILCFSVDILATDSLTNWFKFEFKKKKIHFLLSKHKRKWQIVIVSARDKNNSKGDKYLKRHFRLWQRLLNFFICRPLLRKIAFYRSNPQCDILSSCFSTNSVKLQKFSCEHFTFFAHKPRRSELHIFWNSEKKYTI